MLERGTRQGHLLSAYLSILALEVLLTQVREDDEVKGILINDVEIKLCICGWWHLFDWRGETWEVYVYSRGGAVRQFLSKSMLEA